MWMPPMAIRGRGTTAFSMTVYLPFAFLRPPDLPGLPGAITLSLLMALTFGITTEATRRGPVGIVAPLTAVSPAITVVLAVALLGEASTARLALAVALAVGAAILLAYRPVAADAIGGWLALALA